MKISIFSSSLSPSSFISSFVSLILWKNCFEFVASSTSPSSSSSLSSSDGDHIRHVTQLNEEDFGLLVGGEFHVFVNFHAPHCVHCRRLEPTWEELARLMAKETNQVWITSVDCTANLKLCSHEGVTGYPTLKFYKTDSIIGTEYHGDRDLTSLFKFIHLQVDASNSGLVMRLDEDAEAGLGKESKDDNEGDLMNEGDFPNYQNRLVTLTDETIEGTIHGARGRGHYFVMFHVHWCSHCQKLAPIFGRLAESFRHDRSVRIAHMDCTANEKSCKQYGIAAYPTLYYFVDGHLVEMYRGNRELDDLKAFVNRMKREHPIIDDRYETSQSIDNDADGDHYHQRTASTLPKTKVKIAKKKSFESFNDFLNPNPATLSEEDLVARILKMLDKHKKKLNNQNIPTSELSSLEDIVLKAQDIVKELVSDFRSDHAAGDASSSSSSPLYLQLTENTFEEVIADGTTMVAFVAPWCRRSQALLPLWESLALKMASSSSLGVTPKSKKSGHDPFRIAAVNCAAYEKLCDRQSVIGYPTVYLYQDGKLLLEYEPDRPQSVEAFYDFFTSHLPSASFPSSTAQREGEEHEEL